MPTTRTITGKLLTPEGNPIANGRLAFTLQGSGFDTAEQYPAPKLITALTNDEGEFSVDLWPNTLGSVASSYLCRLPTGEAFSFTLPEGDGSALTLTQVRGLGAIDEDWDADLLSSVILNNPDLKGPVAVPVSVTAQTTTAATLRIQAGAIISQDTNSITLAIPAATDAESSGTSTTLVKQAGLNAALVTAAADATTKANAAQAAAIAAIPASLPPSGGAGGVLSGSYPNPGFAVDMATQAELDAQIATRQATLVSGTNIKTINGASVLGSGDLVVSGGVPTSRAINTTAPLAGGGTLSGDLTLSISAATTSSAGTVAGIGGTTLTNAATVGQLRGAGRSRMVEFFTDFYGSTGGGTDGLTFVSDSSGGGSGISFPTSDLAAGECGVISISTGTTTSGRGLITTSSPNQLPRMDGGPTVFEAKVRIPILSDGTDTFTAFVGGRGTGTAADTGGNDANGFRYTHGTNGGRWLAVSRSGGTEASVDTGIAPAANTWQVLRIEINTTGTSAAYFIDGVLVATITTNIQVLGRGRLQHGLLKSAGTNARTIELDYAYFLKEFSASR